MDGWFTVQHVIFEHEQFEGVVYCDLAAFIFLISKASIKDSSFVKRGVVIQQPRGTVAWSIKALADKWGWSRGKVARFLKRLENGHQIRHQKSNLTTLIQIINYDKYQKTGRKPYTKRTPNGHQTDTIKEVKKLRSKETTIKKVAFKPEKHRPDFISEKDWLDIITHRKAVKATQSERAYQMLSKELKEATFLGITVSMCVDEMAVRGWRGFKAAWMEKIITDSGGQVTNTRPSRIKAPDYDNLQ